MRCAEREEGGLIDSATGATVSVITPAFNAARFIRETIASVQAQTYPHWEMVIADDCSEDNTRQIVEQIGSQDSRVRLIRQKRRQGPAIARNAALGEAKGRYVAFLDSDDLWLPTKLERQLAFMQEQDIAFSYTQYRQISETGEKCGSLILCPPSFTYPELLKNASIGCLTVILDRTKTDPLEFVDFPREDFILWLDLLKRGITAYGLLEDLARYRIVGGSDSRNKWRCAKRIWVVYRKFENLSLPYAFWCFANYAWHGYVKHKSL